jgi:hypothetical protein
MRAIIFGLGIFAIAAVPAIAASDYTVVFPCKASATSQTVKAGSMRVKVSSSACDDKNGHYTFAVSDFPKGFIAKKTVNAALADAVVGAARNVGGAVRVQKPSTVSGAAGREALIDVKKQKAVVRLEVFFVGDRQYQVVFIGAAGQENSKAANDFLGSFKLGK